MRRSPPLGQAVHYGRVVVDEHNARQGQARDDGSTLTGGLGRGPPWGEHDVPPGEVQLVDPGVQLSDVAVHGQRQDLEPVLLRVVEGVLARAPGAVLDEAAADSGPVQALNQDQADGPRLGLAPAGDGEVKGPRAVVGGGKGAGLSRLLEVLVGGGLAAVVLVGLGDNVAGLVGERLRQPVIQSVVDLSDRLKGLAGGLSAEGDRACDDLGATGASHRDWRVDG